MTRTVVTALTVSLVSLAVIAGLGIGSLAWGIVAGAAVVAAVMAMAGRIRPVPCPRCTTPMPTFRRPASVKQALWGGWTCPTCGCEMDRSGRAMTCDGVERA